MFLTLCLRANTLILFYRYIFTEAFHKSRDDLAATLRAVSSRPTIGVTFMNWFTIKNKLLDVKKLNYMLTLIILFITTKLKYDDYITDSDFIYNVRVK